MWMSAAQTASSGSSDRRRAVESALAAFARTPLRRVAPPEGRLGPTDFPIRRLRETLAALGPVFASFGRYLSTRPDLLPRRDCAELALIADTAMPAPPATLAAHLHTQLGAAVSRRFFRFDVAAYDMTLWTERHDAWVAPGVPAIVTIVRPDAAEWLDGDLPLLPLLQDPLGLDPDGCADALDDFTRTLRARLDQTVQAGSLAMLAAHSDANLFSAPTCYRDHSAPGVLTLDRWETPSLAELMESQGGLSRPERSALARRIAMTWLRQAFDARLFPYEFSARDIVVDRESTGTETRLRLTAAVCDPLGSAERERLSRYVNAVAADDPEAAASWLLDAQPLSADGSPVEEEVRRRFRQAVPFRDGEWSGDERFAENVLVQWRVAREAGWRLTPHQLHVYRGLTGLAAIAQTLNPEEDVLLSALQEIRLRRGVADAAAVFDPAAVGARLDTAVREMMTLPQRLDDVLTLAAEGRLRVKLQVPEARENRTVRRQTIRLVAGLVLFAAIASLVRHVAPASGAGLERLGVVALLIVGGWLLVAAARV
jgi:predicted unusual protein kinase regulating ubiquinone biosynthesis (AarF/ABC1/UbiB family)